MNAPLHILLPVHNRRVTTVRFVEALRGQTWRAFRLVLIDDGSSDGTADAVRALWPAVDVVTGDGHWWWAGALDQGCRRLAATSVADADVVLLINDDVELAPDFLARALAEFTPLRDTLLLARQVDAATGAELDFGGGVRADLKHLRFAAARSPEEINCLPTRGLFLRWGDLQRAGGFRPERLPHYLSDYEFTLRAARRGLALRVARDAVVRVRTDSTGRSLANLHRERRRDRFRLLFSPRFKDNPLTWSAFVALAVPWPRRPWLWLKVWLHFLVVAARCVYRPVAEDEPASLPRRAWAIVRPLVPAAWQSRLRARWGWQWFRGDYATWADARAASQGYADHAILDRVLAATHAVRAGRAAFERDGVLFAQPESDAPLLRALEDVRRATGGRLRVLDFGGSLGSTYWRHRRELPTGDDLAWDVVEQPNFVAAGREYLAGERVRFFPDVASAEAAGPHDVLLCSCVLQYLEEPGRALAAWRELRIPYLLLNNLPLHEARPDRLRVQHVPPSIYRASYPVWFFNRATFRARLAADYDVVSEFASEAVWPVDGKMYPSTGLLLRRKERP